MPIFPPSRFHGTPGEQLSQCYRYLFSLSERLNQALSPSETQTLPEKPAAPADFVVEEGVKQGWTYRKWHSGRTELFCTLEGTADIRQHFGPLFAGPPTQALEYPFRFLGLPKVLASLEASGCLLSGGSGTETHSPAWVLLRPAAAGVPYRLHVYVMGNTR